MQTTASTPAIFARRRRPAGSHAFSISLPAEDRLPADRELALLKAARRGRGAASALAELVLAYRPFTRACARRFHMLTGGVIPLNDLESAAAAGLVEAIRAYDPKRKTATGRPARLSTAAWFRVADALRRELHTNGSMVATPQHRSSSNSRRDVRKAARSIGALYPFTSAETDRLAEMTGLSVDEVVMYGRPLRDDLSLDAPSLRHPDHGPTMLEQLPDEAPGADEALAEADTVARVRAAIAKLPPRYQVVIEMRHLSHPPALLKEVGARLGFSVQRASEVEARAMAHLRDLLQPGPRPIEEPDAPAISVPADQREGER